MDKVIPLPKGKYIKNIEVNNDSIKVFFQKRKKIALLFICLNERYWPYLKDVIEDCRKNFLPQHHVDYYVWTDIPQVDTPEYLQRLSQLLPTEVFNQMSQNGTRPPDQWWSYEKIKETVDFLRNQKDIHLIETEAAEWPIPTLMRYHLFLGQEEELKKYEYLFYLDADMRVVDKVSDEILGEGLTTAPHPGYVLANKFLPPIEPNANSAAYIQRLGRVVDDNGKPRFIPFYAAGGFQGGKTKQFIKAMVLMKDTVDQDFKKNYIAIWNDESHWNKFLWEYQKQGGVITFLDPSYVYPDSLINEYYIPLWGRNYSPKIITLTKPFSLSKQAGTELMEMTGIQPTSLTNCPTCGDKLNVPGHRISTITKCNGTGKPHDIEMFKL